MMTDVIANALVGSSFVRRHLGSGAEAADAMARQIDAVVPSGIRSERGLCALPTALDEQRALCRLSGLMERNQVRRSLIGAGYSGCIVPQVLQRNVLENPGWDLYAVPAGDLAGPS